MIWGKAGLGQNECHFVHMSRMDWPGHEHGPPLCKAGEQPPVTGAAFCMESATFSKTARVADRGAADALE
jgi:hypothetical protein